MVSFSFGWIILSKMPRNMGAVGRIWTCFFSKSLVSTVRRILRVLVSTLSAPWEQELRNFAPWQWWDGDGDGLGIYEYVYIYIHTGRTKVALVELLTVNMFGFFFCTPFRRRILAWSFVVPRSHFHPPKALKSYIFKEGDNWPPHTCHTKRTWKCDPQLTEMDVLYSFQEA